MFGCSFSRLSHPRRSVVRTYIEDIKTLFCTPSNHHPPTSIPTLWIAYSELNSPSLPAGQHHVVSKLAVVGGSLVGWTFVQSPKSNHSRCTRRSLVRTYIEDIKTLFCTPSDHHISTSIPTVWIAYSELSSPFWPAWSAVCSSETGGSQRSAWLFGCSFSRLSRPRRSLVSTYIEDIKTDTILYAIRPPPSNLHSYPVDSIQ